MNSGPPIYRAGIIGCGRIGADGGDPARGSSRIASHAEAYSSCARTRLVAACDSDPERLRRAAARWGVERLYRDAREMLRQEPLDLVSVCTPADTHARILSEVLERRPLGVLLEKPVAATLEEATRLLERASAAGVPVSVNYTRRFCPAYRRAVEDVRAGRLGTIQHIHGAYTNGIYANGSHLLDLLRWLFGEPGDLVPMGQAAEAADPTVDVKLTWADRKTAWVRGLEHNAFAAFELEVTGTQGRMRLADLGHQIEWMAVQETLPAHGFRQLAPPVSEATDLRSAVRYAVEDLIEAVQRGRAPACTLADGMEALALAGRALGHAVEARRW